MQTQLADFIKNTSQGQEAEAILRACVHCGFCTATCPTYQLLGDELDSPRGRIYLIKQLLEGHKVSAKTQLHLDRCLSCRSCETTCPSGVQYHRLADIGRGIVAERVPRSGYQKLVRWGLRTVLPYHNRFAPLLRLGQAVRGVLPKALRTSIPPKQVSISWPSKPHPRRMLLLDGCVQPAIAPNINTASARVLDRLGIQIVRTPEAGCCGAVSYHLDAHQDGLDFMRRNIDAWWPEIKAGAEAIIITASGCGALVKEYGHLLRDDPAYAAKAARISALSRDISEILANEDLRDLSVLNLQTQKNLVFHSPCTLQHALQLDGTVEALLQRLGFQLNPVADAHLCCGSAGTYSILQKKLSLPLRENKLKALQAHSPAIIATANIGCLTHLQSGTTTPVKHWIEVLDEACI